MAMICKTRVQMLLQRGIIPAASKSHWMGMDGVLWLAADIGTLSLPSIPNPFHLGHVFILGNNSYLPLAQSSNPFSLMIQYQCYLFP